MIISPKRRRLINEYTAGVIRAREEYYAHPLVFREEDWCRVCVWPRAERRCQRCNDDMNQRLKRRAAS